MRSNSSGGAGNGSLPAHRSRTRPLMAGDKLAPVGTGSAWRLLHRRRRTRGSLRAGRNQFGVSNQSILLLSVQHGSSLGQRGREHLQQTFSFGMVVRQVLAAGTVREEKKGPAQRFRREFQDGGDVGKSHQLDP